MKSKVEIATDYADILTTTIFLERGVNETSVPSEDDPDVMVYTDEAQDVFNHCYDRADEILSNNPKVISFIEILDFSRYIKGHDLDRNDYVLDFNGENITLYTME